MSLEHDTAPPIGTTRLGDTLPTIIRDTRENRPLIFERLPSITGTLPTGDYSVKGSTHLISVERKSIADLVQSVGRDRDRFTRELERLRGYHFKRLLIVGTENEIRQGNYRSRIKPTSVLHTLSAFEVRFDLPVVWCATPTIAARMVESWCYWYSREVLLQADGLLRSRDKRQPRHTNEVFA